MHGNRRSFLGLGAAAAAALMLTSMHVPAARAAVAGGDVHTIAGDAVLVIRGVGEGIDGTYALGPVEYAAQHGLAVPNTVEGFQIIEELAFVDGVYVVPGGEQLRLFYRDKVYKPKGQRTAAMQPDNGAGQVSGDKAQSVGKAGDLKAGRPGGVQSGSPTPGAKTIDAGKPTSWLRRLMFGPPRPA